MRRIRWRNANASLNVTFGQIKSQTNVTFGSLIKFAWKEVTPRPFFPHRFFVHYYSKGSLLHCLLPLLSEIRLRFVTGRLFTAWYTLTSVLEKKICCTVPRGCLVLTVIFHYAWCEGDNFQYATFIRIVFNMHFKVWILQLLGIYLHFSHSRQ